VLHEFDFTHNLVNLLLFFYMGFVGSQL